MGQCQRSIKKTSCLNFRLCQILSLFWPNQSRLIQNIVLTGQLCSPIKTVKMPTATPPTGLHLTCIVSRRNFCLHLMLCLNTGCAPLLLPLYKETATYCVRRCAPPPSSRPRHPPRPSRFPKYPKVTRVMNVQFP